VAKLAADKLLGGRKLRGDTTVVEADIDYPTDADLLEQAVRKVGGLVRRIRPPGAAPIAGSMGAWVGWSVSWSRRSLRPSGCWPRPTSGWPAIG
jgi:hypothetical protein